MVTRRLVLAAVGDFVPTAWASFDRSTSTTDGDIGGSGAGADRASSHGIATIGPHG